MPGIDVIDGKIKRKEAEIATLEKKLEVAKVYLQALTDIRAAMVSETERDSDMALRKGSAVARARELILKEGAPVHIDVLLVRLGKPVTRDTKASLTSSLSAYVRRGEIFSRPAPNTFGLIELGHHDVGDDIESPPPDFGKDTPAAQPRSYAEELDEDIPF
jgi:hypothetical protein